MDGVDGNNTFPTDPSTLLNDLLTVTARFEKSLIFERGVGLILIFTRRRNPVLRTS